MDPAAPVNVAATWYTDPGNTPPIDDLNWWNLQITGIRDRFLDGSVQLANYPNPFADQTTIRYELENAGHVRLSVYNMTGQQIAVLADAHQAAGQYEVTWDAGNHAAGMYFYRLEVDNALDTQKMVLTK